MQEVRSIRQRAFGGRSGVVMRYVVLNLLLLYVFL